MTKKKTKKAKTVKKVKTIDQLHEEFYEWWDFWKNSFSALDLANIEVAKRAWVASQQEAKS